MYILNSKDVSDKEANLEGQPGEKLEIYHSYDQSSVSSIQPRDMPGIVVVWRKGTRERIEMYPRFKKWKKKF